MKKPSSRLMMPLRWRSVLMAALRKDSSSSLSLDAEIPILDIPPFKQHTKGAKPMPQVSVSTSAPSVIRANKPKVSFSNVQVRHYNRILGDNPCCDYPLGLGWKYEESEPVCVDIYDHLYHESNPKYVCAKDFETTLTEERQDFLHAAGYTKAQMRQEERRRMFQVLQEVRTCPLTSKSIYLPPNADVLMKRYVIEPRTSKCAIKRHLTM